MEILIQPRNLQVNDHTRAYIQKKFAPLGRRLRGIGETSIVPPAPAVANAIANAIGVRLYQTPMNPGRILEALASKQ